MVSLESTGARAGVAILIAIIVFLGFAISLHVIKSYQPVKPRPAQKTIKIGCVAYNSGPLKDVSTEIMQGLKLWEKDASRTGIDVSGTIYKPQVICKTVPFSRADIRNAYNALVTSDKAQILVGPAGNGPSVDAVRIAENSKVPIILTYATSDDIFANGTAGNYTFQLATPAYYIVKNVFDMFKHYNVTIKNVAILYTSEPKGEGLVYQLRVTTLARQYGVTVSFSSPISLQASNITGVVNKMVAEKANPNLVFIVASTPDQAVTALRQVKQAGIQTLKYVVLITPGTHVSTIESQARDNLDHVIVVRFWDPMAPISPFMAANLGYEWYGLVTSEKFISEYKAEYGKIPSDMAALGYEAGLLIQYALEKSGSIDLTVLANTIRNSRIMTFYGLTLFGGGKYALGGYYGYQLGHDPILVEYVKKGGSLERLIVWPTFLAVSPLK